MFASKTPRDIFPEPEPTGDYWWDQRLSDLMHAQAFAFIQHNEPNPILVVFRDTLPWAEVSASWLARHWTQSDEMWAEMILADLSFDDEHIGTPEQEAHARAVLTRLAKLTTTDKES